MHPFGSLLADSPKVFYSQFINKFDSFIRMYRTDPVRFPIVRSNFRQKLTLADACRSCEIKLVFDSIFYLHRYVQGKRDILLVVGNIKECFIY